MELRIVGGKFGGRKLQYGGDPRTRPMKERLREAIFNLLGPSIKKKYAIDLFAGTGALGLEAISRGAGGATLIEQHFPTAKIIRRNVDLLEVAEIVDIVTANVFIWRQRKPPLPETPWVVFCSPPYDFYVTRSDEMLALIGGLLEAAPAESLFVVEADSRFDFDLLPDAPSWNVRTYSRAVVGLYRKAG
jgi:16S rRNA (guanine966-N2)-methyltransferase